jgi:hypothetical protein
MGLRERESASLRVVVVVVATDLLLMSH